MYTPFTTSPTKHLGATTTCPRMNKQSTDHQATHNTSAATTVRQAFHRNSFIKDLPPLLGWLQTSTHCTGPVSHPNCSSYADTCTPGAARCILTILSPSGSRTAMHWCMQHSCTIIGISHAIHAHLHIMCNRLPEIPWFAHHDLLVCMSCCTLILQNHQSSYAQSCPPLGWMHQAWQLTSSAAAGKAQHDACCTRFAPGAYCNLANAIAADSRAKQNLLHCRNHVMC